jgi:hypothetical protein
MINIHLNGDIVRCPDIKANFLRIAQIKDTHRICKYNYHEDNCQAWQNSLINWQSVKRNQNCGRCILSGTISCPGHLKQIETGKKKKVYRIDNTVYRKMTSAAHGLLKQSQYKTLFILLTFPKFKKEPDEKQINQCFSKFMENLRTNYNCSGYVAVRERGEIGNRYHFHLLCSLPYCSFTVLNRAWCHSISDLCYFSKNALTHKRKTLYIKDAGRALRYCCKYMAKGKGQQSDTRLIFISNNILSYSRPKQFDNTNCEYYTFNDLKDDFKSISSAITSDYTTSFRINDQKEFERFCNDYLYKIFKLPIKNVDFYTSPPV